MSFNFTFDTQVWPQIVFSVDSPCLPATRRQAVEESHNGHRVGEKQAGTDR